MALTERTDHNKEILCTRSLTETYAHSIKVKNRTNNSTILHKIKLEQKYIQKLPNSEIIMIIVLEMVSYCYNYNSGVSVEVWVCVCQTFFKLDKQIQKFCLHSGGACQFWKLPR